MKQSIQSIFGSALVFNFCNRPLEKVLRRMRGTEVYSHKKQYSIRQNRQQKTRLEIQVKNLHEST